MWTQWYKNKAVYHPVVGMVYVKDKAAVLLYSLYKLLNVSSPATVLLKLLNIPVKGRSFILTMATDGEDQFMQ